MFGFICSLCQGGKRHQAKFTSQTEQLRLPWWPCHYISDIHRDKNVYKCLDVLGKENQMQHPTCPPLAPVS